MAHTPALHLFITSLLPQFAVPIPIVCTQTQRCSGTTPAPQPAVTACNRKRPAETRWCAPPPPPSQFFTPLFLHPLNSRLHSPTTCRKRSSAILGTGLNHRAQCNRDAQARQLKRIIRAQCHDTNNAHPCRHCVCHCRCVCSACAQCNCLKGKSACHLVLCAYAYCSRGCVASAHNAAIHTLHTCATSVLQPTRWGALHALETLSQLVYYNETSRSQFIFGAC